ncbi:MAG: hypothetical protein J6P58_04350 [Oscillospiraceae bacterium]|nr:hypothetical protein [Oscillospiraceae bacterium]
MAQLRVGAGSARIVFPQELFPHEGFKGIHDDPQVKVLVLEAGEKAAIVSAELVNIFDDGIEIVKKIVSEACGVKPEHVWIHVTHAITTPHAPKTRDEFPPHITPPPHMIDESGEKKKAWYDAVTTAFAEAAKQASILEAATLSYAEGYSDVNTNRDVETPFGWWVNLNPEGPSDKALHVIRFDKADGSPIALMVNYALKPCAIDNSQMRENQRLISSDIPGLACRMAEEKLGVPCLFFMSAAGDQVPKDQAFLEYVDADGKVQKDDRGVAYGLKIVEQYGPVLASDILTAAEKAECRPEETELRLGGCSFRWGAKGRTPMQPRRSADYVAERDVEVGTELIALGDMAFVAVKPEVNVITEKQLQAQSPFAVTLLFSMVNGGMKYMPDAQSYERCTWESQSAMLMPGAAEKFVEVTADALRKLAEE